jgi:hypothetical protein
MSKRPMAESQTKEGQRVSIASGGSSELSPPVSLYARKRLRERTSSPRREWRREDAPWHRDRRTQEQETAAGPSPFLPAAGPLPFLPALVLAGPSNPNRPQAGSPTATNDGQREPAHAPLFNEAARQGLPSSSRNEPASTEADLLTNAAIHELQADCPICNCVILQVGTQRRCMMFPGCPFNWRVGWTPYW